MSHFGVLVIADEQLGREQAQDYCTEALAPYDENLEVEEHEVECFCVGLNARDAGNEAVATFNERLGELRDAYTALRAEVLAVGRGEISVRDLPIMEGSQVAVLPDSPQKAQLAKRERELDGQWEQLVAEAEQTRKAVEHSHPEYGKPDSGCESCQGSGRRTTTDNEQARWDWWVIGGRWTGVLCPDYDAAQDERNYSTCRLCGGTGKREDMEVANGCNGCQGTGISRNFENALIEGDVKPVAELPDGYEQQFYALVTPDGQWHQQGRMGWFGMSYDDTDADTWAAYVKDTVAKYPDGTAIVVDCHI